MLYTCCTLWIQVSIWVESILNLEIVFEHKILAVLPWQKRGLHVILVNGRRTEADLPRKRILPRESWAFEQITLALDNLKQTDHAEDDPSLILHQWSNLHSCIHFSLQQFTFHWTWSVHRCPRMRLLPRCCVARRSMMALRYNLAWRPLMNMEVRSVRTCAALEK